MSDLVLVPFADAMLMPIPVAVDPVAIASLSDNIPDGWRAVGPYREELAGSMPPTAASWWSAGCRSGCTRRRSGWRYGAHVDYVDTDAQRLAAAEKLGAGPRPAEAGQGVGPVSGHRAHLRRPGALAATLRATWPDGVCTDTGIYYQGQWRCRCCRCTPGV